MHSNQEEKEEKQSAVERIATLIVDKRKAFYLLYIGFAIFCIVATNWVEVNDDLTSYLPETTETRQGVDAMDREFTTFGTNRVMVDNISYNLAELLSDHLEQLEGVKSVEFDDTEDHYRNGAALYTITYDGDAEDQVSLDALQRVKDALEGYDVYVAGDTGNSQSETIANEMQIVMLIAVVIILLVLFFTSQTYMEIPVLVTTFGMAALMNKGTNFLLNPVSFISDSVSVVLQLALAIDYAIILCHRYTEEREHMDAREATIVALSKAIPEISGSSLTTLSGLGALCFMHFGIGRDLGVVLMKAILLSLLSVFTLMPGLLFSFSKLIDRTHHRSFVPTINVWGKIVVKLRYVLPPIFAVLLVFGFLFSNKCPYAYGETDLPTYTKNASQLAKEQVDGTFGKVNQLAVLVPSGDYSKERQLLKELETLPEIDNVLGLASVEAMDDYDYVLTDSLTPRQFAEMTDLDIEAVRVLYAAYAVDQEDYGHLVGGLDQYTVPLMDMFLFVYDRMEDGYVTLDDDMRQDIEDIHDDLVDAQLQLQGEHYDRVVLELNLPEESDETFAFLDTLHTIAAKYYPSGVLLVGNSTSDKDLSSSFVEDNALISVLTIVFVILVLVFTFQSAGLPVLLIFVIQGSVWVNFSFPYLLNSQMFFLSYLIVSSIQMGANIDYAIVITNRYTELKKTMPLKEAVVEALNQSFPTIVTSGTILAAAGILIGFLSSSPSISSIGISLGRGTIISIFLVMAVLPQILMLGDIIIEKTAFTIRRSGPVQSHTGSIRVNGHVRGYVSGMVDGDFKGTVVGSLNAVVEAGAISPEDETGKLPPASPDIQEKGGADDAAHHA